LKSKRAVQWVSDSKKNKNWGGEAGCTRRGNELFGKNSHEATLWFRMLCKGIGEGCAEPCWVVAHTHQNIKEVKKDTAEGESKDVKTQDPTVFIGEDDKNPQVGEKDKNAN